MRYEDMEHANYVHIFKAIAYDLPSPSRADIAKHLGLSRTAVSSITNSMISYGLIEEAKSPSASGRGRPGCPLQIDRNTWKVLGAAFTTDAWEFVICDLGGTIHEHMEIKVSNVTPSLLIETLIEGILAIKRNTRYNLIPAVGIGVPGVVDRENGDVLFAHDLNWTESFNISRKVEEKSGFRAFIRNRYTLEGIAAYKFGNPEKIRDFLYIGIGSGIRSAIISGGKFLDGATFSAGRVSHIPVTGNDRKCTCGRTGCLITVANAKALAEYAAAETGRPESELSVDRIRAMADSGDEGARNAYRRIAGPLSEIIVTLMDLFDPRMVVIGGPVGNSEFLVKTINRSLADAEHGMLHEGIRIRKESFSYSASALGAASLVSENVLDVVFDKIKGKQKQPYGDTI